MIKGDVHSMDNKLEYLSKFTKRKDGYVRLIQDNEVNLIDSLPESWYEIFDQKATQDKINRLIMVWKQTHSNELSHTISYLEKNLLNIELMEVNGRHSILYSVKNPMGVISFYEGRCPLKGFKNKKLEKEWSKIPTKIRSYYENVHNGFYYYASSSMGLLHEEAVDYLGDDEYDWGILEVLEEPLQIDLKTSFGFFSNGIGDRVAIDYCNCENDNATLWSAKEQPDYNINFWDVVDEWIVIGFESE